MNEGSDGADVTSSRPDLEIFISLLTLRSKLSFMHIHEMAPLIYANWCIANTVMPTVHDIVNILEFFQANAPAHLKSCNITLLIILLMKLSVFVLLLLHF